MRLLLFFLTLHFWLTATAGEVLQAAKAGIRIHPVNVTFFSQHKLSNVYLSVVAEVESLATKSHRVFINVGQTETFLETFFFYVNGDVTDSTFSQNEDGGISLTVTTAGGHFDDAKQEFVDGLKTYHFAINRDAERDNGFAKSGLLQLWPTAEKEPSLAAGK